MVAIFEKPKGVSLRKRILLLGLYYFFLLLGAFVLGGAVANAAYLSELSQAMLPVRYLLEAGSVLLMGGLYARASRSCHPQRLNQWINLGAAGLFLCFWGAFAAFSQSGLLAILFYFYYAALKVLLIVEFWNFASVLLDSREAKRSFGLIALGGRHRLYLRGRSCDHPEQSALTSLFSPRNHPSLCCGHSMCLQSLSRVFKKSE